MLIRMRPISFVSQGKNSIEKPIIYSTFLEKTTDRVATTLWGVFDGMNGLHK